MAITPLTLQLARKLVRDVGNFADEATRTQAAAWVSAWSQLEAEWETVARGLIETSTPGGVWLTPSMAARDVRLRRAIAHTRASLEALCNVADVAAQTAATASAGAAVEAEPFIMASQLPPLARASAAVMYGARISRQAITAIVRRSTETIHALTMPLPEVAINAIKLRLTRGVLIGDNPNRVARGMVKDLRGDFDLALTRAVNIARTEVLDCFRESSRAIHSGNDDVLDGWDWLAKLDAKCCRSCWSMHGRTFPIEHPGPEDHQQGRCTRVPRLKPWSDLGFDGVEPDDMMPDAQTLFSTLPEADQLEIMGPDLLAALRDGRVKWEDLPMKRTTVGWRDSYAPAPLGNLLKN